MLIARALERRGRDTGTGMSKPAKARAAQQRCGSDPSHNLPRPVADWFAGAEPPDQAIELLRIAGF